MANHPPTTPQQVPLPPQQLAHFSSLRPLVRYVDDQQAVIEFHMNIDWPAAIHDAPDQGLAVELLARDIQGQHIRLVQRLPGVRGEGAVRFELPDPQLWWPAGMGNQPLYDMTLRLMVNDEPADIQTTTVGLSSVRTVDDVAGPSLLVHGRPCPIQNVLQIEPADENAILPVGSGSLLIVRHHFGTDTLYEAADRAGILLIQAIPAQAIPAGQGQNAALDQEINRLTAHPSLAGWLVEQAGKLTQRVTDHLHQLDPTRAIFRGLPGLN